MGTTKSNPGVKTTPSALLEDGHLQFECLLQKSEIWRTPLIHLSFQQSRRKTNMVLGSLTQVASCLQPMTPDAHPILHALPVYHRCREIPDCPFQVIRAIARP